MPEIPLLGSLNNYAILSASGNKLVIDGPFFTCDELNLNGWGIPEAEAAGFASTFAGQPIRWCPQGKTVLDPDSGDIVAAEHFCDFINSQKTIVGKIINVYPNGRNAAGNLVYYQKAEVTNPATVTGILAGKIPTNVSMWAYGTEMLDDGMVRGARGMSESIVTEPAYKEATFNYQVVAASLKRAKEARMGATGVYVPNNPKDYGKSTGAWSAPGLGDFTSKSWDDLTEGEKNGIRSSFAAVTDDTFGGCKLPHHNPNGTVVKAGVDNAMARLNQTQGLGSVKSDVEAHLRSHQVNDFKEGKGATMEANPVTESVSAVGTTATGTATAPGVQINIAASDIGAGKKKGADAADGDDGDGHNAMCGKCGEPLPKGADFCPKCGAALHPKCASCGTSVPVGAKFCPACGADMSVPATGTTGDNTQMASVKEQVASALAAARDEDTRRTLAASIAEIQVRNGIVAETDGPKATAELIKLPASVLATQLTQFTLMAAKMSASNEQGLTTGQIAAPMVKVGAGMLPKFAHGLPPENIVKAVFQRLGAQVEGKFQQMSWDHIFKYGVLKDVPGSSNFKGAYHQDRELLPL